MNNSYITVNERFQTSVDDVFAGGDVVIYPNPLFNNKMMNISHWQTAQAHGKFKLIVDTLIFLILKLKVDLQHFIC